MQKLIGVSVVLTFLPRATVHICAMYELPTSMEQFCAEHILFHKESLK